MQTQSAIALFAILVIASPALQAADGRRPRATTITVVAADTPPESDSTIATAKERSPSTKLTAKTGTVRVPNARTRIEFLVPDRSMEAWIVPVEQGPEVSEPAAEKPALRTAIREKQPSSSLSVVNREPVTDLAEPLPSQRQTTSRLSLKLTPAAPPLRGTQPATVVPAEPPAAQNAAAIEVVALPVQSQSQPLVEPANVVAGKSASPKRQLPAAATGERGYGESPSVEIVESNRPTPVNIKAAIGPLEPIPAIVRIPAMADVTPTDVAPVLTPSRAMPVATLATEAPRAPMAETPEPVAESRPPEQTAPLPRRFPARVVYRAPDVAPSPNRGYFVPQSSSIPFGGHGRQPGSAAERTARAPGRRPL